MGYNQARYDIESQDERLQKPARRVVEAMGLPAVIVDWLSFFPLWGETPEKLQGFADACTAVYRTPKIPTDWRAVALENHASAAGFQNHLSLRLELMDQALQAMQTDEFANTNDLRWIEASVITGRMDALPETFDLSVYLRHVRFMVQQGLFNAPGVASRTITALFQADRHAEALEIAKIFKDVTERGVGCTYSLGQRRRFESQFPELFDSAT